MLELKTKRMQHQEDKTTDKEIEIVFNVIN